MRRRLIAAMTAVAAFAAVALGVPLGVLGESEVNTQAEGRLEREADRLAARLQADLDGGRRIDRTRVERLLAADRQAEVRLPGGRVVVAGPDPGREPVKARAGTAGPVAVRLLAPEGAIDERVGQVWLVVILLSLPAVGVAVLAGIALSRRLARPLEALAAQTVDRDPAPAPRSGIAEIDALASALEAGRADIEQLLDRERAFSSDVSHQLRGPLTALRMRLEELETLAESDDARTETAIALDLADRLEGVIAELERFAREGAAGPPATIDVIRIVRGTAEAWRAQLARTHRAVRLDVPERLGARASEGALRQALDVLIDNARRHGDGTVTISARGDGDAVLVTVADEGSGISADDRERVFERHVSLGHGSGLGLSVARMLLRGDGADLRVHPDRAATMEIRLPPAGAPR